ncbi:polyadenylate-binding protein-interacting protein 1 isoform X2 [Genypterus blacodes]|uniref:polyadenylate-binding protein-interacting protein 1 isoform X2 n=1 Tax=Genypterus blacodes TaxID=154954 RepID=UPI003F772164
MNDKFDRAPGAEKSRAYAGAPGFASGWDEDPTSRLFNQREPLRQPRTSPPFTDLNSSPTGDSAAGDFKRQSKPLYSANDSSGSASTGCSDDVDSLVKSSTLSANAAVFVPSGYTQYEEPAVDVYDESEGCYDYATLDEMVTDFLSHLSSSPGSFELEIEYITGTLNSWVTNEESLQELVELIYTQSTAIPNFCYMGARLCNYLSYHLSISPAGGNFRQLLLKRCRTEYEQRNKAVKGEPETQKRFHSYVLFLGELYLNLEVKSAKGQTSRADVLLGGLKDLLDCLFGTPVDANLICAVKLLKLTGSVLDDAWKEKGEPHMQKLIQRIEVILLDATCSRDVRQMLLKLVELRSSDWGRVSAAAACNATPDNDPNYFMNEPTFYTEDGTPFTAADPEKYQEMLDRQEYFNDNPLEASNDLYDFDDEMEPEMEEAYESFCLESELKRKK